MFVQTDEPGVADVRGHALLPEAEVTAVGHHVRVVTINNLHTSQTNPQLPTLMSLAKLLHTSSAETVYEHP